MKFYACLCTCQYASCATLAQEYLLAVRIKVLGKFLPVRDCDLESCSLAWAKYRQPLF